MQLSSLICYMLTFLLIIVSVDVVVFGEPVTENSGGISNNYVFDSPFEKNLQNRFEVNKPSKLRLYLLADLARAAEMKAAFISNCDSVVELKITSKNCTCSNYSCQRYYKTMKKSRILDRNCEDICCGKRSRGKSLETSNDEKTLSTDSSGLVRCGEIIPDVNDKLVIPWIVHVLTKGQELCMGSILSNRAIITSSECVENENATVVKAIGNDEAEIPILKVKEVLTSNMIKNSAILVLSKPLIDIDLKQSPCIPQDIPKNNLMNCYIGLSNGLGSKVDIVKCLQNNPEESNSQGIICAKSENATSQKINPGSPLLCSLNGNSSNIFQIIGTYLKTRDDNSDIYIFDDLKQIKNMITKYLYNLM